MLSVITNIMGNLACTSSSSSGADSDMLPPPQSPGPADALGFGDLDGALQLQRTASEEAAAAAASNNKVKGSFFGKKPKKNPAVDQNKAAQKKAALEAKLAARLEAKKKAEEARIAAANAPCTFVDDRPRFALAPLTRLNGWDAQQQLIAAPLPVLLVKLSRLSGIKSVRVQAAEAAANELAAKMKELQKAAAEIEKAELALLPAPVVVEPKKEAPKSASAVPAAAPSLAGIVSSASAPPAPALAADASFAPHPVSILANVSNSNNNSSYDEHGKFKGKAWAKGTGFGYEGAGGYGWTPDQYMEELATTQQMIQFVLRKMSDRFESQVDESRDLAALKESVLLPFFESYLRNDSMNEILVQHAALYSDIFSCLAHILASTAPELSPLVPLFAPKVLSFMRKIARSAVMVEAMDEKPVAAANAASAASSSSASAAPASSSSASSSPKPAKAEAPLLTSYVIDLAATLEAAVALHQKQTEEAAAKIKAIEDALAEETKEKEDSVRSASSPSISSASSSASSAAAADAPDAPPADSVKAKEDLNAEYVKVLGGHKFGEVEEFSGVHKYQKNASSLVASAPISRQWGRRLAVEFADLAESLPTHMDSSVWMRVHESQMAYAQMMISGPDNTPYQDGLFLFDCFFPPTYPNSPPQVNLCTTGKGTVRFNPNLYHCGKVCLSILGTWSGGVGEGWSAKTSTMLQVAVSIQSLVLVPQPYFNEPSYESTMHTAEGQRASRDYSRPLLSATLRWAMLDQMRNPPRGFEGVVASHFALKRDAIKRQMERWAKDDPAAGIDAALIKEVSDELDKQKVTLAAQ